MKKIVVLLGLLVSCGSSPLEICTQIYQERCYDADKNGDAESVQICDGEHWQESMDCSKQWDTEGNPISDVCGMKFEEAICIRRVK